IHQRRPAFVGRKFVSGTSRNVKWSVKSRHFRPWTPATAAVYRTVRTDEPTEARMRVVPLSWSRALAICGMVLALSIGGASLAQPPAPPAYPPPLITLAEARAIIDGAIAYARKENMRMAVVVVDHAGNVISADRMDGAALQNIRFAEGKAFASA